MAGTKITNATYLDSDWQDEIQSKNLLKKGFYNLSFTNMDNTSAPAITAGSSVDVDGVLYVFETQESITGSPADGVVYVVITGGATATASYTNTALPDYDYDKKGYYGASGERYVLQLDLDSSSYENKMLITYQIETDIIKSNNYFIGSQTLEDYIIQKSSNKNKISKINFATLPGTPASNFLDIAYGNGVFVAITDSSSTTNSIAYSSDGVTWSYANNIFGSWGGNMKSVAFGAGVFVIVAQTISTSNAVKTSTDGNSWNSRTTPAPSSVGSAWDRVRYNGTNFLAVLGFATAKTGCFMTSPDGTTWTIRNAPFSGGSTSSRSGSMSVANNRFYHCPDGLNQFYYSTDGISWSYIGAALPAITTVAGNDFPRYVKFFYINNKYWYISCYDVVYLYSSDNGLTGWTDESSAISGIPDTGNLREPIVTTDINYSIIASKTDPYINIFYDNTIINNQETIDDFVRISFNDFRFVYLSNTGNASSTSIAYSESII